MKKNYLPLLLGALMLCFTSNIHSQVEIALYSGESSPAATSTSNCSATALSRGAGIASNSGSTFNSNNWTTTASVTDAVSNNDYIEWTITANAGFTVTVQEIDIRYDRSGSGPSQISIRSSVDSYAADIFSDASVSSSGEVGNITGLSLTSSDGGAVTFRLYGYDASSTGGTFDIEQSLSPTTLSLSNTGIILRGSVDAATATTTWTGGSGTDWATSGNWSDGVPNSSTNATIPDVANAPIISATTGAEVNDLTITEADGLTIASGGSLRVSGSSSGNITYNRNLGTTNWYLVSSPVVGQTIVDFYTNESPGLGSGSGDAQNVAIAPYDNTQSAAADRWSYYTEGQVDGTGGDDTTDTFGTGIGYSVLLQSAGDVAFTGTMRTDNEDISISSGTGSGGNAFNLIGNPYPSYLAATDGADGTNNLLTVNTGVLSEETIWLWDQSTSSYVIRNDAFGSFYIAPGQGFFVSASGSGTFSFTEAMQSHQTDTFLRPNDPRPEIQLTLTNGTDTRNADIFYIDGTTTGFDSGYDSSIFSGFGNSFAVYTHAVSDGTGRNLGVQSLPNANLETMVVPVGINATSGTNITISASSVNLPTGINVYLEDKTDGSFTLLNDTEDFTTTLSSDLSGIGRFYLHTSSEALSTDDVSLSNVSIYTADANTLRIVGVQNGNAKVSIFNILGAQVLKTSFEGNGLNEIALPSVRTGVYIVQLETETGKLNKKVIIE